MSVQARREGLFALHRPLVRQLFNLDGTVRQGLSREMIRSASDPRTRLWHTYAMLTSDTPQDRALGNAIVRKTTLDPSYDFGMVAALHLWFRLRESLEPDACDHLRTAIHQAGPSQMECDNGFVGMNDNFSAMATMVGVLAGNPDEPAQRAKVIQWAIAKLKEMVDRLENDGVIAEYNSPSYTPITMLCMAEIVNFSDNAQARALALRIEQVCWLHVLACFHPGVGVQGGPTSRSYMCDSCGHLGGVLTTLYMVLGEPTVPFNPLRQGFGLEPRWTVHHNSTHYHAAGICWRAIVDYHPPQEALALVHDRSYPDTVIARASAAHRWRPDDWQLDAQGNRTARLRTFTPMSYAPALLTTHHQPDFTLGSASGKLACGKGGQQDAFFAAWRRRRPTKTKTLTPKDICTLFARYTYNDLAPADESQGDLFSEQGSKTSVQHNATALVLYQPFTTLPANLTSMRLSLVLPLHCAAPASVWLGSQRFDGQPLESDHPCQVFIDDGQVRLCLTPAAITRYHADGPIMRIAQRSRFLVIDLINHQGVSRSFNFHEQAMNCTRNGFACDIASADDDTDFNSFVQRMGQATLTDQWVGDQRHVRYQRGDVDLLIHHQPADFGVIPDAWINGQPRQSPRFTWEQLDASPANTPEALTV